MQSLEPLSDENSDFVWVLSTNTYRSTLQNSAAGITIISKAFPVDGMDYYVKLDISVQRGTLSVFLIDRDG